MEDNLNGLPWSAMISPPSLAALAANEALIEADSPSEQVFEAVGLGKQGLPVPMFKTTTRVLLKDGPATLIFNTFFLSLLGSLVLLETPGRGSSDSGAGPVRAASRCAAGLSQPLVRASICIESVQIGLAGLAQAQADVPIVDP